MWFTRNTRSVLSVSLLALLAASIAGAASAVLGTTKTSMRFEGDKANTGFVTYTGDGMTHQLTLSEDFVTPDAPAPHWQIVDSRGQAYLLQRLMVKDGMSGGERLNRTIAVPSHVPDIAKVQIWCAFAETLLGETTFDSTIPLDQSGASAMRAPTTSQFMGVKANTGTASFSRSGSVRTLTLSDDFKVPDAPAPHWQVVDSRGATYLLQRLLIKNNGFNKAIVVPDYVPDVATVQIWCAWAETLLGEASFAAPVN
jgi:hypothetical protein